MTLTEAIERMFSKKASSPAQRAVNAGAPDAAEKPTEGQKRVGNYRKVHLNIDGFRSGLMFGSVAVSPYQALLLLYGMALIPVLLLLFKAVGRSES